MRVSGTSGAGVRQKNLAPRASVAERIIRCPRCGVKLAEAKANASVAGLTIKCRRCHIPVTIEI